MDGIKEADFLEILESSVDRRDLQLRYFDLFRKAQNKPTARCFDKTPQNVYGLPLIKSMFPEAKIIHIVRNPLNVVSSLIRGRGLLPQSLTGAINFWHEALMIINTLKPVLKPNLYELKYEDLTQKPQATIAKLLNFLSEDDCDMSQAVSGVKLAHDSYLEVLNDEQITVVKERLSELMHIYQY